RESVVRMTSFHLARMARRVELAPQATSPTGCADFSGRQLGFTLLEVICVLAIIAIIAAIALAAIPLGTSRPRLDGYALQNGALPKSGPRGGSEHARGAANGAGAAAPPSPPGPRGSRGAPPRRCHARCGAR